jgi:hypothetical protein
VDGRRRRLWVFLMTLSSSRHRARSAFLERQDVATWLDCHVRALELFGGVPETVLLDHLKAGVVRADLYDPTLNRAYAELERHDGFTGDPARVRSREAPRLRLSGACRSCVAGRLYRDLAELNERALAWGRNDVGQVAHGTTQELPLVRFEHAGRAALRPRPASAFDPPVGAGCKVHPDHHLGFQRSYYSVPTRLTSARACGYARPGAWSRSLWKRPSIQDPSARPLSRQLADRPDRLPRGGAGLASFAHPSHCRERARELGPHIERTHAARACLAQGTGRGSRALTRMVDGACAHLLAFESSDVRRLTRILEQGLIDASVPAGAPSAGALEVLHPPESFAAMAGVAVGR